MAAAYSVTEPPVIVKVPVDWREAIVPEAGTVATFESLEESATVTPAPPAGPPRVRVPVAVVPPGMLAGEIVMFVRTAGVTVRTAVFVPL